MSEFLIEKCLETVPNRFELSILAMNRAKELLHGAKSKVETTKYTKKAVNKAIKEIENNEVDLEELKEKIKRNLLVNNLFLKDNKNFEDAGNTGLDLKTEDDFDDDMDDDLGDDFSDDLDEDINDSDVEIDDLD